MLEFAPICIYLVISLLVSLILLGLILFCWNLLIALYEFTMEKVLFVLRSLKEKLVINLESLLLHGNEDFREKILKREEKRRKSQNKVHMARRGNPISGGMFNVLFRIWIVVLFLFFVFTVYFLSLVLGFDLSLIWVKLKSMLLLRSFRFLFCRLLGWEVPFILLLCLVSGLGLGGSTLYMQDPAGGQPQLQPGEQAMPPANPVASGEAEAGPSHFFPFTYNEEESMGGDSVLSIQTRLLAKYDFPSAEQIEFARREARKRFEIKVDIIRLMTHFHPEGDWEGQGARALDNARTKTGEQPFGTLCKIRDSLSTQGIQSRFFSSLRDRVLLRKENSDNESQA